MIALAAAPVIAIVGATVYQTPDQKVDDATVVIRDGKIAAVGKDVAVPADATKIDGKGKIVTAGLIDAYATLGLTEIGLEPTSDDGTMGTSIGDDDGVHAAFRTIDGYDADAMAIPVARTGGVTDAVDAPSGDLVSGQGAWFPLAAGVTDDDAVRAPAAVFANLGAGITVANGSRGRAIEMLRGLLDDAADYAKHKADYDRNAHRKLAASKDDLEALAPVLKGTEPLVIAADAAHDIRAALRLAKERKLKLVILGGAEAWKVAPELAKAKVPVILDPQSNEPNSLEAPDVRDDDAAVLAKAGVPVAIVSITDGDGPRSLRMHAGDAVGDGLPWASALAAITTVPAAIYGVKDRGTVTKGAIADVVVWSGDPLEISTQVDTVIIGGVVQSLETHQSRLLQKYR